MVSYIQIENLAKRFGDTTLFSGVDLSIAQGDKVGLIARNGKGKSTLLSIIAGEEDYQEGRITMKRDLRTGYLPQNPSFDPERSLLWNIGGEDPEHGENARRIATQLRLDIRRPDMKGMSGGERKRAAIARVLAMEPDMLILDEPTNHLDIDMIEWLEDYLSTKKTTILMVTHDRYFLDNVCSRIVEIDMEALYSYDGNYDYYLEKREERRANMAAEKSHVDNLLRKEREWMRRQPQARGSKARYRIESFHDLERRSKLNLAEKDVRIAKGNVYIGSKIFEARNVAKSFGGKSLFSGWTYDFARGEKVGIVGANGAGKTTLLKMILGDLKPDEGTIDVGQTVRFGYYSQEGYLDFDEKKRVIDAVTEIAEHVRINDSDTISASSFLTRFLFSPADQRKYIYKLSGGERRRLYLATILMRNPNFLILDEPTNDLDIQTLAVLEDYIAGFGGCVLTVSHDRYFLDRVAEHLFVLDGTGTIKDFPGDYSTYRHCLRRQRAEAAAAKQETAAGKKPDNRKPREQKAKLTFNETRERASLEEKIPLLEKEKQDLEMSMSSGSLSSEALLEAGARIAAIIAELDESEMRLLELMEKAGE